MNLKETTSDNKQYYQNISSLCLHDNSIQYFIIKTFLLIATLLLLTTSKTVFSDPGIVEKAGDVPYRVPLTEMPVTVDAVLDEEVWEKAVKIDANIEVRPGENIPAPVKTEAAASAMII